MKKIASLLLLFFAAVSCTTEVTRNSPAFEAYKDDVRWRAKASYAEVFPDQSVIITGISQFETVTLQLEDIDPGTYALGGIGNDNLATYDFTGEGMELAYTTESDNELVNGEVVIEDYDPITMKISGTFRFNAENIGNNPLGGPLVNFQHGFFYKVAVVPSL